MTIRLVIFDFDGTLADSFPWFLRVMNLVADQYGFKKIDAGEIETLRGFDGRKMMAHLGVPWWKLPFIARHIRKRMAENIHEISLFDGVGDLLRRLSSHGVTLAIVTSNAHDNVRSVLGPENAALIRHYQCGVSMFGKGASFRRVLEQSRIPASQALCIGDELRDAEAAREAGILFGGVTWGFASGEALRPHAPAGVFSRVDEIAERIILTASPAPAGA